MAAASMHLGVWS